ncbi:MAG: ATP synthase F1 subunit gamma [Bacteroidetes bacterium]|nr:ATP synthase F1 subunit gamma [Bacteroidota bacterium]
MANLKEVRTRMVSVKSTQQITKAMKMVSAAKLRRAQDKIIKMRSYAQKLHEMMSGLSQNIDGSPVATYFESKNSNKVLFVLVSSDRGLCGAFNSSLIKSMNYFITKEIGDNKGAFDILNIGKKGHDGMSKFKYNVADSNDGFFNNLNWADGERICQNVLNQFNEGKYAKVYLVYNEFKNAATYFNRISQLLPIAAREEAEESDSNANYIFEPSQGEILEDLVPRSLKTTFYSALLDSNASEHGARMTAMDNATENAQELLRSLSIEYNKARQAAITNEILEIVGGAEALENG